MEGTCARDEVALNVRRQQRNGAASRLDLAANDRNLPAERKGQEGFSGSVGSDYRPLFATPPRPVGARKGQSFAVTDGDVIKLEQFHRHTGTGVPIQSGK